MGLLTRAQIVATAAGALTLSMIGIGFASNAVGAGTTSVSQTHASSTFLAGTLGSLPEGAVATNDGGAHDVTAHELLLAAPVNPLLQAGTANQIAFAGTDGVARALSGAVDDGDEVAAADMSLSLSSVTGGTPLAGVVQDLTVKLGALSSAAAVDAKDAGAIASTCNDPARPVRCRDYDIAGGSLTFKAPLVGALVSQVPGSLEPVTDAVAGLAGPNGELAKAVKSLTSITDVVPAADLDVTATVDIDGLNQAVSDALSGQLSDGVVRIDLTTGEITVDLDELVTAATGKALNNQAPNTQVLSKEVIDALTGRLVSLIDTVPGKILDVVTTTVDAAKVELSANVCILPSTGTAPDCRIADVPSTGTGVAIDFRGTISQLLGGTGTVSATLQVAALKTSLPTGDILGALAPALRTVTDAVRTQVEPGLISVITTVTEGLAPALAALPDLLSLVVNVQEPTTLGGVPGYAQSALRIGVAGALDIEVARSEVAARLIPVADADPGPIGDPEPGTQADPEPGVDPDRTLDPGPTRPHLPVVPTRITSGT